METKLERLLDLHSRMLTARYNATLCGSRHDWQVARQTEEAFELAHERFCAELRAGLCRAAREANHAA